MLSSKIKSSTQSAHQELEKKVIMRLKAIRSNSDYADLLKYFYAYFSALEEKMDAFITADILPDYAQRRHADSLKADILSLGSDINDLPTVTLPEISNSLQAIGALYVMEGSIMGGSIIVQMLAKGGITDGVSFFSGYGASTPQMWGIFVEAMNALPKNEAEANVVINSANDTFNCFSTVFEPSLA